MNKRIYLPLSVLFLLGILTGCNNGNVAKNDANSLNSNTGQENYNQEENTGNNNDSNNNSTEPIQNDRAQTKAKGPIPMIIDVKKTYTAILHTEEGDIEIALNADQTPITVNNFVSLAKKDFYDNTIFHRVIKGFMIQGGDPTGTGTGGPGYKFDDEAFDGEYTRGTIAMANSGRNTNGSQFFIMHQDYPLQKDYVIFGHVTKGFETVDKIAEAETTMSSSGEKSQPVTPVKIKNIDIIEK